MTISPDIKERVNWNAVFSNNNVRARIFSFWHSLMERSVCVLYWPRYFLRPEPITFQHLKLPDKTQGNVSRQKHIIVLLWKQAKDENQK